MQTWRRTLYAANYNLQKVVATLTVGELDGAFLNFKSPRQEFN
jgi:hypothetical protein